MVNRYASLSTTRCTPPSRLVDITRLVWVFCNQIQWPCPASPEHPDDPGITRTKLALSFTQWSQRYPPIKICAGKIWHAYDENRCKDAIVIPLKNHSLRVVSESFRYMVKHIHTFSSTKLIPTYALQGATCLTCLKFAMDQRCRILGDPNCQMQLRFTNGYKILPLPHNPPCHTEIDIPTIPATAPKPEWPAWPEISLPQRESFSRMVRNHTEEKFGFNSPS